MSDKCLLKSDHSSKLRLHNSIQLYKCAEEKRTKARYTATQVACCWAGAVVQMTTGNSQKVFHVNQLTDAPTDRQTERVVESRARDKKTRPDTRLPQSRAGGQGPYSRSVEYLGRSGIAKNPINAEKVKCDGWTDGRTDGRTDG